MEQNETEIEAEYEYLVYMETSILMDPYKGLHQVTRYYPDGTIEESMEPRSPALIHYPLIRSM